IISGKGIELLHENNIEVKVGILADQEKVLNRSYRKYITYQRPFVTLKCASTLDGKIATFNGDSKWISNNLSREKAHIMRHTHDAIMVGINTIIRDNPRLTTRLSVPALNPTRIIVDSKLRIPENSNVI